MGIYIKGIEIPKEGDLIVIRPDGKAYYVSANPQNAYEGEAVPVPEKPITNADKIRTLSDEELAKWRAEGQCPPTRYNGDYDGLAHSCEDCWLDWLQQEVKE